MVAPVFFLFTIAFLRQIFIVMFINVKKRKKLKHAIKELAEMSDPEPINYLIHQIDIALLIDDAPWSTVVLFTTTALRSLNVDSKAILVDALQKRGLRYNQNAANAVEDLFLSCKLRELTDLKNMTDMGGDYQNLFKLIYSDITNTVTRDKILSHFKTEAFFMIEKNGGTEIGLKVLSDIDDTLYSSGGKFPAGCDKEYPKHQLYPGVLKFFAALDHESVDEENACNLVFLSARPHVYKDGSERHSYHLFNSLYKRKLMHVVPTLLPGKLKQGLIATFLFPFIKTKAWKAVGELKYKTFKQYCAMYPEYGYVFCGDDGQGDLLAGEMMMAEKNEEERVKAVFIHRVISKGAALYNRSSVNTPHEIPKDAAGSEKAFEIQCEEWEKRNIFVTETYLRAAAHAFQVDLIDGEQLQKIGLNAIIEFDEIRCLYPANETKRWLEAEKDFETDIAFVNGLLSSQKIEPLPEIKRTQDLFSTRDASAPSFKEANLDVRRRTSVPAKKLKSAELRHPSLDALL